MRLRLRLRLRPRHRLFTGAWATANASAAAAAMAAAAATEEEGAMEAAVAATATREQTMNSLCVAACWGRGCFFFFFARESFCFLGFDVGAKGETRERRENYFSYCDSYFRVFSFLHFFFPDDGAQFTES
jgi:hypothetical protein